MVKYKRDNAIKSAKVIALVAIPPFHCAIAAKFHPVLAVSVLRVEMLMALWIAAIVMK